MHRPGLVVDLPTIGGVRGGVHSGTNVQLMAGGLRAGSVGLGECEMGGAGWYCSISGDGTNRSGHTRVHVLLLGDINRSI